MSLQIKFQALLHVIFWLWVKAKEVHEYIHLHSLLGHEQDFQKLVIGMLCFFDTPRLYKYVTDHLLNLLIESSLIDRIHRNQSVTLWPLSKKLSCALSWTNDTPLWRNPWTLRHNKKKWSKANVGLRSQVPTNLLSKPIHLAEAPEFNRFCVLTRLPRHKRSHKHQDEDKSDGSKKPWDLRRYRAVSLFAYLNREPTIAVSCSTSNQEIAKMEVTWPSCK